MAAREPFRLVYSSGTGRVCPGRWPADNCRCREATLLMLKPRPEPRTLSINGQPTRGKAWTWHGFEFDAIAIDLVGEVKVQAG